MNIRVSNIDPSTTVEDLQELFEEFGEVLEVRLNDEPDPGKDTYSAVLTMAFDDDAEAAIDELNGENFDGRFLRVRAGEVGPVDADGRSEETLDEFDEDFDAMSFQRIQRKRPGRGDW
ncbi:MAG: RNA-binding protein [Bacteroidetes bacterium]|nr:MAG: RNA-binding protein [Bacteroidota bacterium]